MRAVIQRVSRARVVVGEETVGEIGAGFLALIGAVRARRAPQDTRRLRHGLQGRPIDAARERCHPVAVNLGERTHDVKLVP